MDILLQCCIAGMSGLESFPQKGFTQKGAENKQANAVATKKQGERHRPMKLVLGKLPFAHPSLSQVSIDVERGILKYIFVSLFNYRPCGHYHQTFFGGALFFPRASAKGSS